MLQAKPVGVTVALTLLALASSSCATAVAPTRPAAQPTEPVRAAPATLVATNDADHTDDTVDGQQTRLMLPFEGAWIVGQGYHGSESHHGRAAFALDLVKLDADGNAYVGRGRRPEDWVGFGAPLLATAAGVVVRAIDRHADNRVVHLDAPLALGPTLLARPDTNDTGDVCRIRGAGRTRRLAFDPRHPALRPADPQPP